MTWLDMASFSYCRKTDLRRMSLQLRRLRRKRRYINILLKRYYKREDTVILSSLAIRKVIQSTILAASGEEVDTRVFRDRNGWCFHTLTESKTLLVMSYQKQIKSFL